MRTLAPLFAASAAAVLALAAPPAQAGCSPSCRTCCLPQSHTVNVPGVAIAIPGVYVQPPSLVSGVGGDYGYGGSTDVSVSASASASGVAYAPAYAAAVGNAQAANLLAASGGGGGGFYSEGGSSISIPSLVVQSVSGPATQPVCSAWAAVAKAVAIQASCVDDKAVPHPASQLSPDRDVAGAYEGELFRCIAGAHLQYVTTAWTGAASFDHGQTVACAKGDALWRARDGRLQCRPQAPARDCNERSLLRRFGAGIKVVQASAQVCTAWNGEAVAAAAALPPQDFGGDGGVGR